LRVRHGRPVEREPKGDIMFDPHHRRWAACRLAAAALVVGLLASACGSSASSTASSASEVVSSAAAAVSSAASVAGSKVASAASSVGSVASSKASSAASAVSSAIAGATGPAEVGTTTGPLGTFLVDSKGMTLYMYVPDTAGVSTCYDQCAVFWPPLLTTGAPTASGSAEKSKLSTSARTDGSTMVNYGVWPLYYFKSDTAPEDTKGQGNQDVWYVVGVDGQPIKTPAS
jgi:predicted lipoprotein with Yx(FWY)xxD motif